MGLWIRLVSTKGVVRRDKREMRTRVRNRKERDDRSTDAVFLVSFWVSSLFVGTELDILGRSIYITLIGRRSRLFAGARYLKRGANDLVSSRFPFLLSFFSSSVSSQLTENWSFLSLTGPRRQRSRNRAVRSNSSFSAPFFAANSPLLSLSFAFRIVSEPLTTPFHTSTPRAPHDGGCSHLDNDPEHHLHQHRLKFPNPRFTSYVQYRGSIPLLWSQDASASNFKPPIESKFEEAFAS